MKMKDYRRSYPMFSLCGLNCGLCPIHHMGNGCPGCGGGTGNQPCAIIRCSLQNGAPEYCFLCARYPCEKYAGITDYDSFLSHRNMRTDFDRAKRIGLPAYQTELTQKIEILRTLLARYQAGRQKSFFCTAVSLLPPEDTQAVMAELSNRISPDMPLKEKAAEAVRLFGDMAERLGIDLKLRRKPRKSG